MACPGNVALISLKNHSYCDAELLIMVNLGVSRTASRSFNYNPSNIFAHTIGLNVLHD